MRRLSFALLIALSLGVAGYAVVAYSLFPLGSLVHPQMRIEFEANSVAIYTHIFCAAIALVIGPFQFWNSLRQSRPTLHRWLGRVYLGIGVLAGGLAGLAMAFHAFGGLTARLGFGFLALAWLYSGTRAFVAIRSRNVAEHRRWMYRNFALTLAAVTLRLYLPSSMLLAIPFDTAYPLIAWICWVPNLLVAEWMLRRVSPIATAD
jgi:uncharacterized membrane protein